MAVKIRLMRVGKKKQPSTASSSPTGAAPATAASSRSSASTQPRQEPSVFDIDADKVARTGCRRARSPPSRSHKLLEIAGVWESTRPSAARTSAASRRSRPQAKGQAAAQAEAAKAEAAAAAAEARRGEGRGRRAGGRSAAAAEAAAEDAPTSRRAPTPSDDASKSDDDFEDDDDDDYEDEVGAEGNRIIGGRAKAVVEHVARNLADEPDGVDVDVDRARATRSRSWCTPSPGDMGRLIGKRGRVIQALRQVARAAGAAEGVKATVDVAE